MNCKEALRQIHEYLDGDLDKQEAVELKKHLLICPDCSRVFRQMETTDALVKSVPRSPVPGLLTESIMAAIPQNRKSQSWVRWMKRHPALSVASFFFLVMFGSFLSLWNQDTDLEVKGASLDQLVIQGDTVYLPAGRHVDGNLMVKRGKLKVDGEVKGNLIVVDGTYNMASTAKISGRIYMIDQALEWLWFQVNDVVADFSK